MTDQSPSVASRVSRQGDLINHDFSGDLTGDIVAGMMTETDGVVEDLQAKQKPVLILSDFSGVKDQTAGARNEMRKAMGTRYFDRIAAFGVPSSLQIVGQLLIKITGKGDRVKIFDTKEAAETWLREFRPV